MSSIIGNTAGQLSGFGKFAFQTFAHAHLGGVMNGLTGGDYLSGFVSGATASIVAEGIGKRLNGIKNPYLKAGGITFSGAVSGGAASVAVGGNFWHGFRNGMISAGLNHAAHSGFFGKGLAIVMITGRLRHFVGPDGLAFSATANVSGIISAEIEGGGMFVRTKDGMVAIPLRDIGAGVGWIEASVNEGVTELYHSGSLSEINIDDFYGVRWEGNVSVSVGVSLGMSLSYSKASNANFVIGTSSTIGLGFSPTIVSGYGTYGASGKSFKEVRRYIQQDLYDN